MITIYAAYKQVPETGRQLELATPAKIRLELEQFRGSKTIFQDKACNLYSYKELQGQMVRFTNGETLFIL